MTSNDLKTYLKNGNSIDEKGVENLKKMLDEYPFFQSAKILYTKGLRNINSLSYKNALEKTATSVNDRKRLYEFVIQEGLQDKIEAIIEEVKDEKVKEPINKDEIIAVEDEVLKSETENEQAEIKETVIQLQTYDIEQVYGTPEIIEEELELPKLENKAKDKFNVELSFSDWLSASNEEQKEDKKPSISEKSLIDNFISNQPKITPNKITEYTPSSINKLNSLSDESFTTETLARIYVTQKNYSKAIATYEQLSLKFPNKKAYFATQIENLKRLLDSKK